MRNKTTVFIAVLLAVLPAVASAQPTISILSAQYNKAPPFLFKLPVYISNVENATGINFNLTFDPTIVSVENVSVNETFFTNLKIWGVNINNDTGFANIAIVAENPITTTDSKPLVDIEFKAINYGYTDLNFTFAELSLPDFNTTNVLVENGSILIISVKPERITCAGFCHAKYVELKTDFVPNIPISFNQSNVILGIFKEYNRTSWTIPNPVIELYYNTSELYPPHTRGNGSFDELDPTPTVENNVIGYVKWNLPDVTINHSAAVARAFDFAQFGLIVDKPEMSIFRHSQDVITTNGTYWTNITVNVTDCFRVTIFVKLMNNSYMDANVVSWNSVTPPGVHARIDVINKTLVAIFERYSGGWNPTNGTIRLNVSYYVTKFTNNTIIYKPDVKVVIRKRVTSDWLNGTVHYNSYNVSLRSVLFDRWANFSSSSKLNWTTEEFDMRVIKLKGYFNVGGKPDLIVIGKDEINVQGGYKVQYIIKNIGNATAPPGHKTALIVDGKLIETKAVPIALLPGATFNDTFNTTVPFTSPPDDTITVVTDYYDNVDELNESNNNKTNVYPYPPKLIWNATISATNQLEPVVVGMHPNATDGYDPEFDAYTQTPIQNKVILCLDGLYAKNIKRSVPPGSNVTWILTVGVPSGQTTTLTWNKHPHPQVILRIFNGTQELEPGATIGEGAHTFKVVAEVLEKITFTLHLKAGWNMVSLPIVPDNSSVYDIFKDIPTLNIRPVVTWQAPIFVPVKTIEPKKGYWVFTPQDIDIVITGTPIKDKKLTLKAGWNMIGTVGLEKLNLSLIPNQVSQRPPVTWQAPIFVPVTEVEPGKAVWVFVVKDTEVEI